MAGGFPTIWREAVGTVRVRDTHPWRHERVDQWRTALAIACDYLVVGERLCRLAKCNWYGCRAAWLNLRLASRPLNHLMVVSKVRAAWHWLATCG